MIDNRLFICDICKVEKQICGKKNLMTHMRIHANERKVIWKSINKKCPWCDDVKYTDLKSYKNHLARKHSEEEFFKCWDCDNKYFHPVLVRKHWMKVHTTRRLRACRYCPQIFRYFGRLKCHEQAHEYRLRKITGSDDDGHPSISSKNCTVTKLIDISCELCSFKADTFQKMFNHLDKVHKNDEGKAMKSKFEKKYCFKCDIMFNSQIERIAHNNNTHLLFNCNVCKKEFYNIDVYEKHLSFHTSYE